MQDPLSQNSEQIAAVAEQVKEEHCPEEVADLSTIRASDVHEISDEDWESERQNIVRVDEQVSHISRNAPEDNEDESEEDPKEFVYPDAGSVPHNEATPISVTMETALTEYIESNQAPFQEQALLVSPPQETLQFSIVGETPPIARSPPLTPEVTIHSPSPSSFPSPAQLESLHAAATSGDFLLLKGLFMHAVESNTAQQFNLANDALMRTGFTMLHVASSRGHLEIVQWRESSHWPLLFAKSDVSQSLRIVVQCLTLKIEKEKYVR